MNRGRRLVVLVAVVIGPAACGSDSKSADTTAARATPSIPSTTAAAAPTTRAPATTTASTTTAAAVTTVATLSREAKLAVTKCLDDLSVPTTLLADLNVLHDATSTDAAVADCKDAGTQVGVDVKGSQLAVTLASIGVELAALKFASAAGQSLDVGSPAAERYSTVMIPLVPQAQQQLAAFG